MAAPDDRRLLAWERRTEWPLIVLAVLFLVVYAVPILDPELPRVVTKGCALVAWAIWAGFAVDYAVRVFLASDRLRYVRSNLLDLATVVLPVFRPFRVLRVVRALRVLDRRATASLHGRVIAYVAGGVALVVFVAALAVLDAERHTRDATITSFRDAVWWAFATITTVGYGDVFPVTQAGRLVAVGLMLAGIALLGVVTATIASWFVQRVNEVEAMEVATRSELDALVAELRELRAELRERLPGP